MHTHVRIRTHACMCTPTHTYYYLVCTYCHFDVLRSDFSVTDIFHVDPSELQQELKTLEDDDYDDDAMMMMMIVSF